MKLMKMGLVCGLLLAGANAMACYTVYDKASRVVYRGMEAPVDMSQPLHEALASRFPAGASMVFEQGALCTPVSLSQVARPSGPMVPPNTIRMERTGRQLSPSSAAPLLTDRHTAQRQQLPYTVLAGDIVLVAPPAAARAGMSTFTVIPAESAVARAPVAPDTAAMGAGPAQPTTVITEMRNPPLTIVERGGKVTVRRD